MGLGGRAIDLVGENQVGDQRAFLELHLVAPALGFDQDRRALDIRRHHVGSELDPREADVDRFTQGADENRLAESGYAFEQYVSTDQQRCKSSVDNRFLSDDDVLNRQFDLCVNTTKLLGCSLRSFCA